MSDGAEFEALFEEARKSPAYWTERAILEFTERENCTYNHSRFKEHTCHVCGLGVRRELRKRCPFRAAIQTLEMASSALKAVEREVPINAAATCDRVIEQAKKAEESNDSFSDPFHAVSAETWLKLLNDPRDDPWSLSWDEVDERLAVWEQGHYPTTDDDEELLAVVVQGARELVKKRLRHFSPPTMLAPDGEGGITIEWRKGDIIWMLRYNKTRNELIVFVEHKIAWRGNV